MAATTGYGSHTLDENNDACISGKGGTSGDELSLSNPAISVTGTWDTATVTVAYKNFAGSWITIETQTDDFNRVYDFERPVVMRAIVSSVGASTDLDAEIR